MAIEDVSKESKRSAREAGLRYVTDEGPGIERRRRGKGFYYVRGGKVVRDKGTLGRIKGLVIPPAWEGVWIAPVANAHLQATGRDQRGRKQSKYHEKWREVRDGDKFGRVIAFGKALPRIRKVTARHLRMKGLPREKVLAAVVQCLEKTLIRVGNDEYTQANHSFGLTTIRDRHVKIRGKHVHFDFMGKSGVHREVDLDEPRLAKVIKASQDLPGEELLQYVGEDGKVHDVKSEDVNGYLHEISGGGVYGEGFSDVGGDGAGGGGAAGVGESGFAGGAEKECGGGGGAGGEAAGEYEGGLSEVLYSSGGD
ncbi:MAG TPA: hypothetical protein VFE58_03975 [Tepidisphaeraceae bacterium]|nr:hypothetical protein [Tepidisphaeraceae bacterium]